ncbi:DEAD/DEAH box helicase [Paenibacillus beijingensis]|uniref:Helicase SNF n=1 Tax=Paenibacillus beijingensis TaxID=1126833 RepID=A0A0D5NF92_9BACL|nr:DEAD/DEAH box helicase [Paenibacillus beijingensis]AJY73593.1 helicase SNF [Paenibacillus beijingensis]
MRRFVAAGSLLVNGHWEPGRGIALYSSDPSEYGRRLSNLLFAWHPASWYGTELAELEPEEGRPAALLLTPLLAVDYFAFPRPVRLLEVEWGQELEQLARLGGLLREALIGGWFAPHWRLWSESERRWQVRLPESEPEAARRWNALLAENGALQDTADEWLSLAVEELIADKPGAAAAWERVEGGAGPQLTRKSPHEEDWLIAIGLKKDTFPFRTALQLAEPEEGRSWRLRAALQDREGGQWIPLERQDEPGRWLPAAGESWTVPEDWLPLLKERLIKEEERWLQALPDWEDEAAPGMVKRNLTDTEAYGFLEHASLKLLDYGCAVVLPGWWEAVRKRKLRLKAKLKSSVGSAEQPMFGLSQIVQFDWKLAVGDVDLTEAEFLRLAEENRRLMQIGGQWVHLNPDDVRQIREWMKRVGRKKGLSFRDVMQMHLQGGIPVTEEEGEEPLQAEVELNENMMRLIGQLQNVNELPLLQEPEQFRGELRPYQRQGMSWLLFLRRFGLGACLADDMGLGKTVQFTAYLLHVKELVAQSGEPKRPSLLICPTSVIGNWEKELERFAPTLDVRLHYGPRRMKGESFAEFTEGADLVITSYSLAPLDEEELASVQWETLCLDESQNIKNVYTKQSSAIRRLSAHHRIAMTGTPMENRLTELWSIYDFINTGYLGTMAEFRRAVILPIERERDEKTIAGLQRWVKPFMLRRLKKDPAIELSLPDKNENKMFIALTAEQGAVYENIVADLLEKLDTLEPMQRRGLILASITKLKQVCDHPALLQDGSEAEREAELWDPERSAKVMRLLEMCEEVAAEGERCLIFTQFVDMGATLQKLLEERLSLPVPYLHGGVPKAKRDEMIAGFQNQEQPGCAFVLSLKAGGTGLNLTAANHVFHFDRWWNPAVENQATDRAFRIGQKKRVQVHKFVSLGTLEEKIDDMIERKQSLNEQVVGQSEQWITELSKEELRELFTLRKQWLKD